MMCPCEPHDVTGADHVGSQDTVQPNQGRIQMWGLAAGGGILVSPHYQLRVHVAQPVAPAVRKSPNYSLLLGQGP
jgi:hypothetical protein